MSVFKTILFFVVCFLLSVMFSLTFSLCGEGLNLKESLERKHLDLKRPACCWASHIYFMLTSWSYLGVRSWEWRGCFWSPESIFSGCFGEKQLKAHSTLHNCEISTTEMHFAFCLLGQRASMCPDEQPELALFLQEFHSQITHAVIAVLKSSTSHENSLFLFFSDYFHIGLLLPPFLCTQKECWFLLRSLLARIGGLTHVLLAIPPLSFFYIVFTGLGLTAYSFSLSSELWGNRYFTFSHLLGF